MVVSVFIIFDLWFQNADFKGMIIQFRQINVKDIPKNLRKQSGTFYLKDTVIFAKTSD